VVTDTAYSGPFPFPGGERVDPTSVRRVRRSALFVAALAATGCGGTHHLAVAAAPNTIAGPSGPDACALASAADIRAALPGLTFGNGQGVRRANGGDCLYLVTGTSRAIDVKVFRPGGKTAFNTLRASSADTVVVTGLGDKALSQRGGSTVAALKGDTLVEVVAENDDSDVFRTAVRRLVGVAVSRL
jgi:hypothetical protein